MDIAKMQIHIIASHFHKTGPISLKSDLSISRVLGPRL